MVVAHCIFLLFYSHRLGPGHFWDLRLYYDPPATTIVQPTSCSTNFITNPIPFVSLHICIIVGFFRHMVLGFLFDIAVPPWLVICTLLLAILATNRKAQKHVALRIRQKVAMMTVGRNNAVHPIISVALVPLSEQLRDQVDGVNPC